MGYNYEEPDMCGFLSLGQGMTPCEHKIELLDFDSRRGVAVTLPNLDGPIPPDDDPAALNLLQTAAAGAMLARLPPHPHLALVDRVVLDESRPALKMKWLRQLMGTVDDLNLKHGTIQQDIAGRNLILDRETDSIMLINFNTAYRVGVEKGTLGAEGRWGIRDDGKGVLVFLYEYNTRDPALARY
ncbi:hypothetical protein C8A05DRAFT_37975 [Staphylotrichum tortipilum]|uniref:Protein kinase domain-containing protein n=1 Tax=Staphylotrichum tortipilum TaxID=2831512 RepID=A0AAN6MCH7_9PEZI|nr:hypothetical protein C8A05DRAFT_37975 [Staphylotrichum longicolle]